MKTRSPLPSRAVTLLAYVLATLPAGRFACAQVTSRQENTASGQLVAKAHALEMRGRLDMAQQAWQQVLLINPNNAEALAGMARAAKLEGRPREADGYLARLRQLYPTDPELARIERLSPQQDPSTQMAEAARLAQAGEYVRAMAIYRQLYGNSPPAGDVALTYYQTEAASEEMRASAVAGLRALASRFPSDPRYAIALGKVLTYSPRTRAEGRALLEKHPESTQAQEALRQSLMWDEHSPATAAEIRSYLARHQDPQLAAVLASDQARAEATRKAEAQLTPQQRAAQAVFRLRSAEDQTGYRALVAGHRDRAEQHFQASLAQRPQDGEALAGLGFVRMAQGNFGSAISYLEQARQAGAGSDPAVAKALNDSRFFFTMQAATAALNADDLAQASAQFEAALRLRPNDPGVLRGLGGTYLKAGQPVAALPLFTSALAVSPADGKAWSGLLVAEAEDGRYQDALSTDSRMPADVHRELMEDPAYLRSLAMSYRALGREADAQRILEAGLDLPFPRDGAGMDGDRQLQFAALLSAAGRPEQAVALYRQQLATNPNSTDGWVGLITTEHELDHNGSAYADLQAMPAASRDRAMREPGFAITIAALEEAEVHEDRAKAVLEALLVEQKSAGQASSIPAQVQLAGIESHRGGEAQAFGLYRSVLAANPNRTDAWQGLLSTLHATGHDEEALAQIEQVPVATRLELENDPAYLQTVASIYAGLGQPQSAILFLTRARQRFKERHVSPPVDLDLQSAWLLYNSHADAALYQQLMSLGARPDLTDSQRLTVEQIWTSFALRRAGEEMAEGHAKRALAVLKAAAQAFPANHEVRRAVAGGYLTMGEPRAAVAIFRAEDLRQAPEADFHAAVGAALAANDLKMAETWLRFGLERYPRDPEMLRLAGRFEQARGDDRRAVAYLRSALALMPNENPEQRLAKVLDAPSSGSSSHLPLAGGDLATLLAQPVQGSAGDPVRSSTPGQSMQAIGPIEVGVQPLRATQADSLATPGAGEVTPPRGSGKLPKPGTLGDFQPQTTAPVLQPEAEFDSRAVRRLHASAERFRSFFPGDPQPLGAGEARLLLGDEALEGSRGVGLRTVSWEPQQSQSPPQQDGAQALKQAIEGDYPAPATGAPKPHPPEKRRDEELLKRRAADIRANQADAPQLVTGQSHPPEETIGVQPSGSGGSGLSPAHYATPAGQPQVAQPGIGQQYPQPGLGVESGAGGVTPRRRGVRKAAGKTAPPPPSPPLVPQQPVLQAPLSYPALVQPATRAADAAKSYAPGQPPTDLDLQMLNLPPLRGYVDTREDDRAALTVRQQTELDLQTIEGSYSPWLGAAAVGRYRSGTEGLDRLTTLEIPFEASTTFGKTARLSVVPVAVFLNSGQLNTTGGGLGSGYLLGTLRGNAAMAPAQEFASGLGGELQLTTNSFAGAIGSTPSSFPVSNVIGHAQWRPAGGHFLLFGGRSAVKETQLSYAGFHDPANTTLNPAGNLWGGVTQNSGGVRFDMGDETSGLYAMAEGGVLTGYHVLQNSMVDGTLGAYFRAGNWPAYGSLNVGGFVHGEHFRSNERPETYGLGGYFSPSAYILASVPVSFTGHSGLRVHYVVSGSLGLQSFQEQSQNLFPLDAAQQIVANAACAADGLALVGCSVQPVNSNTGANFSFEGQVSYRVNEHWYVGGFLNANNTNDYDLVQGGFFARFLFRPQVQTIQYPTGLFPVEGLRPVRVP